MSSRETKRYSQRVVQTIERKKQEGFAIPTMLHKYNSEECMNSKPSEKAMLTMNDGDMKMRRASEQMGRDARSKWCV